MARRRAPGFTLVELLVALAAMALMAGIAWQGVDGIVRARDASGQRLEQALRLNTVLAQWEHDLAALQDTQAAPALDFDGATLRLTRHTTDGVQIVAWSLRRASGGGGGVWQRWAGTPVTTRAELQEQWLRSQQLLGNEAGQLRALEGIADVEIYFFRGAAWTNAQSSGDVEAPGGAANAPGRQILPSGVRLVLGFDAAGGRSGDVTRDIALGPQQP